MDKKTLLGTAIAVLAASASLTSCEYDDTDLWNSVNSLTTRVTTLEEQVAATNSNLAALRTIVESLQSQVTITAVEQTENGYRITFSDGKTADITNGVNAPAISVTKGDDGKYYWTLGGEIILVDGKPLPTSAVAPQVRINPDTKMWEISTDEGDTWTPTGVKAEGSDGESFFSAIDTSNPDYVVFTLVDGTQLKLARYDESAPVFSIESSTGVQQFLFGETINYTVTAQNVADYSISKPDGWTVKYTDGTLTIKAPAKNNSYAETSGIIAINVVSAAGRAMIAKIQVEAVPYRLKVLTFEDADAKFAPFTLDYCSKTINTWSDLIDDKQYGGPMLYGSGAGMSSPYKWSDDGNTMLSHTMPASWGSYCYWGGGHAISNYYDTDPTNGDFMHQLSVFGTGGHNGSSNCAVHYGYRDNSGYTDSSVLCSLEFSDGKARVIDHMWIMNTTYAVNCYVDGNGLTAKIGPDDWVKIQAIGYDAAGTQTKTAELYTCNGPDHIVLDWTKWDLTSLGAVAKVEFNILGSSDNGYGFSQPAYFAYDDVAVQFTE